MNEQEQANAAGPVKPADKPEAEALRLAAWIEDDMTCQGDAEIAAELRRQHGEIERLRAYVNAAHWWSEAHDNELVEAGDTRHEARRRMLGAEMVLLAAGYVFERA